MVLKSLIIERFVGTKLTEEPFRFVSGSHVSFQVGHLLGADGAREHLTLGRAVFLSLVTFHALLGRKRDAAFVTHSRCMLTQLRIVRFPHVL